ncbi:MAG: DNA-binding protein [Burkholderiales bacterium]|nr:DNA-binding protein [Burkholderiales bacterium]
MPLKTREEVQSWFQSQGISIADWAMEHGFSAALTREVIKGRRCIRGQSHHIAVALGMKAPTYVSDPIQP